MAISRAKTWVKEVLTFADLNAEFDNIINNALSLISPLTGNLDVDANKIILDGDQDTSIRADTDDQIDFEIGGTDKFKMNSSGLFFGNSKFLTQGQSGMFGLSAKVGDVEGRTATLEHNHIIENQVFGA